MVLYCPWCGAPIPKELINDFESHYSLHTKEVCCIRCNSKTFFWSGCNIDDSSLVKILEEKEVE